MVIYKTKSKSIKLKYSILKLSKPNLMSIVMSNKIKLKFAN